MVLYCNNHNDPKGSKISRFYLIPPDCALMSKWFWVGGRLAWVGGFTGAFPIAVFHFSLSCASASSRPLSRISASTSLFQVFFGRPGPRFFSGTSVSVFFTHLSSGYLSMCPRYLSLLSATMSLSFFMPTFFRISSVGMWSKSVTPRILLAFLFDHASSFGLSSALSCHASQPHRAVGRT